MVWGTGTPRREFLYVDDLADACIHLMKTYSGDELVNIGTGEDITIAEFARVVAATVGYTGADQLSTPRGRTARRANCSTSAGWPNSAGAPRPRSRTASGSPIRPISTRQVAAELKACRRR